MTSVRPTFRIIFFSLLGLIVILAIAGGVLSNLAVKKVQAILKVSGVTVGSLRVDLLTRSITMRDFVWKHTAKTDSVHSTGAISADSSLVIALSEIHASNINVFAFLRYREIRVGTLVLSGGKVRANRAELYRAKQAESKDTANAAPIDIGLIQVGRLSLNKIEVIIKSGSLIEHQATVDVVLDNIALNAIDGYDDIHAYKVQNMQAVVVNYRMADLRSMYTLDVRRMAMDSRTKELRIDSIVLLPKYGKYQFSRKVGKQVDRFVLQVPNITLTGLDFSQVRDSTIVASRLKITGADLYVFRDKRLPFIKHNHTPLPVTLIRRLPFGFALDSLLIANTKIKYEEFPEEGFETGYIVFDKLQASAANITNREHYPKAKQSLLHVTSRVMQDGLITVDFTFPYDKAQVYHASGRISGLGLQSLNPMLVSLAFIKVESGTLNTLDFEFDYDDFSSRGNILINYENLKLAGLTKEKNKKENNVKSLALGLFVRKDKDREVPIEKRSGKIYYERDRRRAIFNVWVKSLFSGVKSSVIDPPSERKTLTRKERREEQREKRRENKAKKRKDREEEKNGNEVEADKNTILP